MRVSGSGKVNAVTGGTFTGTNSYLDGKGNAAGTGRAVFVNSATAVLDSFGGKCVVEDDFGDAPFTGKNYGIQNNNGTVTIADGAVITGDNLYAAVYNYHQGKLTIKGGTIGSERCTYGVWNDQANASAVPELTITGGTISGSIGVYNEGRIVSISGGSITGTKYGVQNIASATATAGEIASITGGTMSGGDYGLYNQGVITTLGGGSFSGKLCGAYIESGSVGSISGNIKIVNGTPWGVVYSSALADMPEGFDNSGKVISGATASDPDANYKDMGVVPTVSGTSLYANGYDITIDARPENPEKGAVITWTNPVFGEQSVNTGDANWSVFVGAYGRQDGLDAEETGTAVVTNPAPNNAVAGTITVNMNGGVLGTLYGGGHGNTRVTGKVVMNFYGGKAESIRGGGIFDTYYWGNADWGRGWAVVENLEMNILGPVHTTWVFDVGGRGNAWVENAVVNVRSSSTDRQNQITLAGDNDGYASHPIFTVQKELYGLSSDTDMTIDEQAAAIKNACLEIAADGSITPKVNGIGTVVMNAKVNFYVETKMDLNCGNYGGHPNSYTGNVTVNFENGGKSSVTDTTLEPQGTATRAQCAAMLMRFAEL